MSKLKIGEVLRVISSDYSYSLMIDWMRLKNRYGNSPFSANDPELMAVLKCRAKANVSGKLAKLFLSGWAARELPNLKNNNAMSCYRYTLVG
jgi:hypothetical protein